VHGGWLFIGRRARDHGLTLVKLPECGWLAMCIENLVGALCSLLHLRAVGEEHNSMIVLDVSDLAGCWSWRCWHG
jgi:hypothetical protein